MDNLNLQYIEGFGVQLVGYKTWAIDEFAIAQCYLVEGEDRAVLIDTGTGQGNLRAVVDQLTDKPYIILNTHGHFDHIGGNDEFTDHEIYMSDRDDGIAHLENRSAEQNRRGFEKSFHEPGFYGQPYYDMDRQYGTFLYQSIREGDIMDLGGRTLRIYETPGHSLGSLVALDETYRYLFSGDTVVSTPVLIFAGMNSGTVEDFRDSLAKMMAIRDQVDLIYPGHYLRPIGTTYIEELYTLADRICRGDAVSEPADLSHMTSEPTIVSRYKNASIIYTEEYIR